MNQLEQLKAKAREKLAVPNIRDIATKGLFTIHLDDLDTLIETVYQARTEEIQHVIGEARDNNRHNATEYGEGVYEGLCYAYHLIATLKDTKISKE